MTGADIALFVGDIGLDTTLTVGHLPGSDEKVLASAVQDSAGGVTSNAAYAAHRAGATARLLCATGDDTAGHQVVTELRSDGIVVETSVVPGPTCRAFIIVEPVGEKRLILVPGVSMYPRIDSVRSVSLEGVRWVHTASYEHAAATVLAERCRNAGLPWSVDLEPATLTGDLATLDAVLAGAAVVFVNTRAARLLGEDAAGSLLGRGVRAVVLSCGSDGARWITATSDTWARPAHIPGPVLDTTGAGDCLAGWFIATRLAGSEPVDALNAAVTAASISCRRLGARASFPDPPEVQRLTEPGPTMHNTAPRKES